jgi:hypothetical protein
MALLLLLLLLLLHVYDGCICVPGKRIADDEEGGDDEAG